MNDPASDPQNLMASDVVRCRDAAIYWLLQRAHGIDVNDDLSRLMASQSPEIQRATALIGMLAVDEAVGSLLCWLWSDDRIQMHYIDKDGTEINLKKASDGWHGDYVGYGTHGGWIHELSKYKDGLPPVNNG
ncbi:MAG: hypothetical protein ACK5ZG_12600 [Phycisphaerae bacterium]